LTTRIITTFKAHPNPQSSPLACFIFREHQAQSSTMERPLLRTGSLPFDNRSSRARFQRNFWTGIALRYLIQYLFSTLTSLLIKHAFSLQNGTCTSLRRTLLFIDELYYNRGHPMFDPYLRFPNCQTLTRISCFENLRMDLDILFKDTAPFWLLEIARWMYFCDRKSFWVGVQWPSSKWATFLGIATAVLFCIQHGSAHAVWMAYLRANARATICRDRAVLKVGGSVQGVYSWLVRRETEKRRIICMENQEYVHDELDSLG